MTGKTITLDVEVCPWGEDCHEMLSCLICGNSQAASVSFGVVSFLLMFDSGGRPLTPSTTSKPPLQVLCCERQRVSPLSCSCSLRADSYTWAVQSCSFGGSAVEATTSKILDGTCSQAKIQDKEGIPPDQQRSEP